MSDTYDDEELMGDYTWPSPEELEAAYPGIWDDPKMRDWLIKKLAQMTKAIAELEGQP